MAHQRKSAKLTLTSLVLMIFTSVFGFTNIPRAFYLMGYAAIFWYIIAALTFFIPFAFMIAEYGAAFKDYSGGIYSWMAVSFGPEFAFIGTFMSYASYIVWMVNIGSAIWIPFSSALFGTDKTQQWSFLGLGSVQTLGLLAIAWMLVVTFISTKGLGWVKRLTSIGGIAVALINVILLAGGFFILLANHKLAEPLSIKALVTSPNPDFTSLISIFSFLVYAIFAYGGLEVTGGLVDETKNAAVTFPRGITLAAVTISTGYALGIFIFGAFTNWTFAFTQFGTAKINLGNVAYVAMNNMGYQFGHALAVPEATARLMGQWLSRYMGLSMFLALSGAFLTLVFSPLKQLIEGTPNGIWPKKLVKLKHDVPVNAMKVQATIVILIIALVSFGGNGAKTFFDILVSMTNVAMTIPYLFIAFAFLGFKRNAAITKPFVVYKTKFSTGLGVGLVLFSVGFANIFTIIEPAIHGNWLKTGYTIAGPILFSLIAWGLYHRYQKQLSEQPKK